MKLGKQQIDSFIKFRKNSKMSFRIVERWLFFAFLLSFLALSQSQSSDSPDHQQPPSTLSQSNLQQTEHRLEEQFKNEQEEELNPWVVEEMHSNEQHPEVQPYDSVIFHLKPNVTHVFRVPVSLQEIMMVEVSVYHVGVDGEITLPQNPQQKQYVQVISADNSTRAEMHEGVVYITKIFELHFSETHKFLKFRNNGDLPVIVLLDMQEEELMIELAVSDDKFELTNKKMQSLIKQAKETEITREHMYKWQWGFYEKHQRHQVDMLGFTGAELIAIIGTSIVQMYCIKNLIDKELII